MALVVDAFGGGNPSAHGQRRTAHWRLSRGCSLCGGLNRTVTIRPNWIAFVGKTVPRTVLPEWFYNSVIDRSLVLTIDPAYFRLTGGIERWLYRVARKHAGHQPEGWAFEVSHLHQKSGSAARPSDFALDLRRIAARQSLPGYLLQSEWKGREHPACRDCVRFYSGLSSHA
ncbi:replication initiator protein A [Paenirhodobacter populi]